MSEEWELTTRARRDFDTLDSYTQERIIDKLDDIVRDEWREPPDYVEPLEGSAHDKIRIGQFRLGVRADRSKNILYVLRIRKRGGDAYRSDD